MPSALSALMTLRGLLIVALLSVGSWAGGWADGPILGPLLGSDGAAQGQRGNTLFEQENYAAAVEAYRTGLRRHSDSTDAVFAALQNNLGAALHRQEKFADARTAFDAAHRASSTPADRVRALYNAGNASAGMGNLEEALRYYRQALLLNPEHQPARHNFEVLKRELQSRQEQTRGNRPPDVEPSAYAKQLKRQADALVARRQYADALSLMKDGVAQDSTVRAYARFIQRLDDVTGILDDGVSRSAPGSTPLQSQ